MSLALVLEKQYPGKPGIRTRENDKGKMEIFDWPSKLGPKPTKSQIAQWTAEFEALPTPEDELVEAVRAANSIAELKIVLIDAIKAFK